ncbi:16828_t:CDS:1, partial [Racocetra fulgida]
SSGTSDNNVQSLKCKRSNKLNETAKMDNTDKMSNIDYTNNNNSEDQLKTNPHDSVQVNQEFEDK